MEEMLSATWETVREKRGEGREVVMAGDFNGWIGELPSVIKLGTDEEEILERKSERTATNPRGRTY